VHPPAKRCSPTWARLIAKVQGKGAGLHDRRPGVRRDRLRRLGSSALLAADVSSFFIAALATVLVREHVRPAGAAATRGECHARLAEVREGRRWLEREADLRRLLSAVAAINLLFMPVLVLLPVYVTDAVHARGRCRLHDHVAPQWSGR
jgi:hypothetical protein